MRCPDSIAPWAPCRPAARADCHPRRAARLRHGLAGLRPHHLPGHCHHRRGARCPERWLTAARAGHFPGAKSALISALSLCLLLRTDHLLLAGAAASVAVLSKVLIRVRDKHVFNPTNFALIVMLVTTDAAWVSPGQWGTALLAFAFACAGLLVVHRATRSDVTLAFLASYAAFSSRGPCGSASHSPSLCTGWRAAHSCSSPSS